MRYKGPGLDPWPQPWVVDLYQAALENENFRAVIWTGDYLQTTLMSLPPGGEIGLERHDDLDQMLRVEEGSCRVYMGATPQDLRYLGAASPGWAIYIPAGTWHNVLNCAAQPLKLSSLYAPPQHPRDLVQTTKAEAEAGH